MSLSSLLAAVLVTGAGATFAGITAARRAFQAVLSGTGALTGTILIQVSLDGTNWLTLGTITLSGTTLVSDGFVSEAPWPYVRANCSAITGTAATLTVLMGT